VPSPEAIPLSRLPHGEASILLSRALGDAAEGIVRGYREPAGDLPACLLIELMAQTAGLALPPGAAGAVVAGIPRMRLHRDAGETDTIEVTATRGRRFGRLVRFECRATSRGDLLADGEIVLRET